MKEIKEIVKKPSEALQAMVDGLRNQSKREDFIIDFSNWGTYVKKEKVCYGCAATCTLQQVYQTNFTDSSIDTTSSRAEKFDLKGWTELMAFELAIDAARNGGIQDLFNFFNIKIEISHLDLIYPNFCLGDDDWEYELPKVEAYIKKLKKLNL